VIRRRRPNPRTCPEDPSGFVLVVSAAVEGDVLDGRRTLPRVRVEMVPLAEAGQDVVMEAL
jgi:hypothetical protein